MKSRALSLALLLLLWSSSVAAARVPNDSWRVIEAAPTAGTLRGDWVEPSVVLLAYEEEFAESQRALVRRVAGRVPVVVLRGAGDDPPRAFIRDVEAGGGRILDVAHDTAWVRDWGPFQLSDAAGRRLWLDADYGADRPHDDSAPAELARYFDSPVRTLPYTLDGGAVISNGGGLCAITEYSLGGAANGGPVDPADLAAQLGCSVLVVIPALFDEETGHADVIAQFASPTTVIVSHLSGLQNAANATVLSRAARALRRGARLLGIQLRVVRAPMMVRGARFYSYVNALRVPGAVVVPSFRAVPPGLEARAFGAWRRAASGAELIEVPGDVLVRRGGAIHCISAGLDAPAGASVALPNRARSFR